MFAVLVLLAMLLASGARAAVGMATGSVAYVTPSSAKLNASVIFTDPITNILTIEGANVWFEFGATTNYGGTTAPVGVAAVSPTMSSLVSGLQAETLHHFRVVASNASGVVFGSNQTFTTRPVTELNPGHGLSFNGVNGYVTTSLLITNPQTFTLSLWFKAITSRGGKLIGFGNSSNANSSLHDRAIYLNTNGTVSAGVHDGVAVRLASGTSVLNNGLWHHVACTFSPATGLRLYVDGVLEATNLIPTNAYVYNGYWRLGWDSGWLPNPQPYLDARVDEVQVWNVARPAAEIAGSLTAPLSGSEPGLVEYWRFTEGEGTTTADGAVARGSNTATLVGDVRWQLPAPLRPFAPLPLITPLAATGVSSNGARLNGTVNPNGSATAAWFEYGPTTNYTAFTPMTFLGPSNVALAVSNFTQLLAGGSTYHFRLLATNATGLSYSSDQTFNTAVIAPAAITTGAGDVTRTGATLGGSVNPRFGATLAWFEYGPDAGTNSTTAATALGATNIALAVSNSITGLAPGMRYRYRIIGSNSAGTTLGGFLSFTTAPPPLAAQTLAASDVREFSATFNGTVNSSGFATTWYFQFGLTTNYGMQSLAAVLPGGVASTPVALSQGILLPGNTYHCRIVASNATGMVFGNDVTFFTPFARPLPTTWEAIDVTASNAVLRGLVELGGGGGTAWFEYGTNAGPLHPSRSPYFTLPLGNGHLITNFLAEGLEFSRTYNFSFITASPIMIGGVLSFTTLPLAPVVRTLPAGNLTGGSARLGATVHPGGAVTRLWFDYGTTTNYGAFSSTNTIAALRTNVTTSGDINGLLPGVTYHARVVAENSAGRAYGSNFVFNTPGVTAPRLNPPTRLPDGALQLAFTNTPGVSFTVRASTNIALPAAQWINLGPAVESPAGQFRFTDTNATHPPQRFYRVTSP